MAKLHKLVLQYGHYRDSLNWIRAELIRQRISQADFARYLRLDPKGLSCILNGLVVPNAALFDYMKSLLGLTSAHVVFKYWLFKNGCSSLHHFRNRSFVPITVPEDHD